MRLKEKGRFYEIPIQGYKINEIVYNGMIRLIFNDSDNSYLDLHGDFQITRFNQTTTLSPKEKESFLLFYELFDVFLKEAKADKLGRLYVTFENGFEIAIDYGPFESWHFTSINKNDSKLCLHVHGGIGILIF